ncbi:hypothetical protein [Streptomyces prunicolor]
MSDRYALNRSLNQEASLILVAGGHAPARFDTTYAPVSTGFQMGLDPSMTPDSPDLMVMFLHSHFLTNEEVERGKESPEARERVLAEWARRQQADAGRLLPAYAECLRAAGWEAEVSWKGRFVRAVPPRAVVDAASTGPVRPGEETT